MKGRAADMDINDIARRVKELREILDISALDISKEISCTLEQYEKYESGESDIPISALFDIAKVLGVDMTVLTTGDMPKMNSYSLVRRGDGVKVERYPGYSYENLAFNFAGREMEPMIVRLRPDEKVAGLVSHSGQEFNIVLSGCIRITVGAREFDMSEGDSIYFDAHIPHKQVAIDGDASFLTIIQE